MLAQVVVAHVCQRAVRHLRQDANILQDEQEKAVGRVIGVVEIHKRSLLTANNETSC